MFKLIISLLALFLTTGVAQPRIVTSIHPYFSLLSQLVGEAGTVTRLLPPGASPHTFDPSPQDVLALAEADLIVLNGGLDEWLVELSTAAGQQARLIEVLTELDLEQGEEHGDHDDHADNDHDDHADGDHADEDTHDHGGVNPHVWLDPLLMKAVVPVFVDALVTLEPDSAEVYRANGEALLADLDALNADLTELLGPLAGAAFVPFHDAWPYFADRYGLDLVVEIEPAPGREPSPAYIAEALTLIRESGAKAIFSEVQLPARPAEVVADNAGVPLYLLDPIGGSAGSEQYQDMLRANASVIATALAD